MCCIIFLRSNPLLNCLWKWFQFGCKDMILFWVYGAVLFCVAIYLCNKNFIPKSYLLIVSIFSSLSIFSWLVLGKPVNNNNCKFFFLWRFDQLPGHDLPLRGFAFTPIRHTMHGRAFLDECSALSREFFLTTHNTQNRQSSMSLRGFEPWSLACERPQAHALERAATGVGDRNL